MKNNGTLMLKDVVNTITTEFRVSQKCDDYADPLENKFTSPIIHKLKKKNISATYI